MNLVHITELVVDWLKEHLQSDMDFMTTLLTGSFTLTTSKMIQKKSRYNRVLVVTERAREFWNACHLHQFQHKLAQGMAVKDLSSLSKCNVNIYNILLDDGEKLSVTI